MKGRKENEATAQLKQVNDTEKWLENEWDEERKETRNLVRPDWHYISIHHVPVMPFRPTRSISSGARDCFCPE